MPYVVDVGIPVDGTDESVEKAMRYSSTMDEMAAILADGTRQSSGMGFGFRDLQYEVKGKSNAQALAEEFQELLSLYDDAYVSVYYELPHWLWILADKVGLAERYFN